MNKTKYKELIKLLLNKDIEWKELMNKCDEIFGQNYGTFIHYISKRIEEEEDLIYTFESILYKIVFVNYFKNLSENEIELFMNNDLNKIIVLGETKWKLNTCKGLDYYIEPIGFNLFHDFTE